MARLGKQMRNLANCVVPDNTPSFLVTKEEFCSYEEYENATLTHVDSLYVKKTKEECQSLCDTTTTYHCRGYSVVPLSENSKLHSCFLHSEDTKVHGPKLLTPVSFAKYYEKARCLNGNDNEIYFNSTALLLILVP